MRSHELNPVGRRRRILRLPTTLPYRPDPIFAVLIDPTGTQGWAVGGTLEQRMNDWTPPTSSATRPTGSRHRRPAPRRCQYARRGHVRVRRHAQCAAPCADRNSPLRARPSGWPRRSRSPDGSRKLRRAWAVLLSRADRDRRRLCRGGPAPKSRSRASSNATPRSSPVRRPGLRHDLTVGPRRAARAGRHRGRSWETGFAGFPRPFGSEGTPSAANPRDAARWWGASRPTTPSNTRARGSLVLDDTAPARSAGTARMARAALGLAGIEGKPVIAVGNADLGAQIAADDGEATDCSKHSSASTPTGPRSGDPGPLVASAYFYDSPEENVSNRCGRRSDVSSRSARARSDTCKLHARPTANFHRREAASARRSSISPGACRTTRSPVSSAADPGRRRTRAGSPGAGRCCTAAAPPCSKGWRAGPRAGNRAQDQRNALLRRPVHPDTVALRRRRLRRPALLPEYTFSSSDQEVGQFVDPQHRPERSPHRAPERQGRTDRRRTRRRNAAVGPRVRACSAPTTPAHHRHDPRRWAVRLAAGHRAGRQRAPAVRNRAAEGGRSRRPDVAPAPPPAPAPAPPRPGAGVDPAAGPAAAATGCHRPRAAEPPGRAAAFFLPLVTLPTPLLPFVPPPVPTPARPTPPSGTSAVTSPIEVAEKQEEEEEATESVSNQAVAYRAPRTRAGARVPARRRAPRGVRRRLDPAQRPRRGRGEVRSRRRRSRACAPSGSSTPTVADDGEHPDVHTSFTASHRMGAVVDDREHPDVHRSFTAWQHPDGRRCRRW